MAELTIKEFARLGGLARAKRMTPEERAEAARKAGQGNAGKKRKPKSAQPSSPLSKEVW